MARGKRPSQRDGLHFLALWSVLLLAFALRIYHLDGQSMWSDEGLSLYRAQQPGAVVVTNVIMVDGVATQDTNPPLYFLLLHGWRGVAGESVFALRFLGVVLAVLSVPVAYKLGTAVYGQRVGLATAVFLALSPLHVWQSQLLRNYGLLLSLNLLSLYGLWRFLRAPADGPANPRRRWLALWMGAGVLGVYTHYFGFFVLALGVLTLLIWGLPRPAHLQLGQRIAFDQSGQWSKPGMALGLGLVLLLFILLPIIPTAMARFQAGQQVDFYQTPLVDFLYHAVNVFSAGVARQVIHPWWRTLPVCLLAVWGVFIGWHSHRQGTVWVMAYQFVPLGLLWLFSLINPLYNGARHLLIGLPPFLLLCAVGMVGEWPGHSRWRVGRWPGLLLGLLALGLQGHWLEKQFTAADLRIDDVRGAADYLTAVATPDDLIILHDTLIGFTFDYYYAGAAPWRAIPLFTGQDVAQVTADFAAAGAQTPGRIWFLNQPVPRTGFPTDVLPAQADAQWTHLATIPFPSLWLGTEVTAYLPHPTYPRLPETATAMTAVFGPLSLVGGQLPQTVTAGIPWWLSLYWSGLPATTADYMVSLRLSDEMGTIWQQWDQPLWNQPPGGEYPGGDGLFTRTDYGLRLPAGLPPGGYTLWLRLLDATGNPLPGPDGPTDWQLGPVRLQSSHDATQLPPHTAQIARRGGLTLLGYRLPEVDIRPGHLTPIELFWQVAKRPERGGQIRLELLDAAGVVLVGQDAPLTRADYAFTQWQPGEILQSRVSLPIPGTAVATPHTLRLTVIDENGRALGRPISLNRQLPITAWPLVTELPPFTQAVGANFGQPLQMSLAGVDLPQTVARPGDTVPLTLIWQAGAAAETNYAVFVHLTADEGTIVAQRDGLPVQGARLTESWRPGEVIVDRQDLTIGADVPPGRYELFVGLYDAESGQRPLTFLSDQPLPDGRVSLGIITISDTTD